MIQAYKDGKDLYSVIAQLMYHNNYEDNLEYFKEFSKITSDNKTIIAGTEEEHKCYVDENKNYFDTPYCYLLPTPNGNVEASKCKVNDTLISDEGKVRIINIENIDKKNDVDYLRIFVDLKLLN